MYCKKLSSYEDKIQVLQSMLNSVKHYQIYVPVISITGNKAVIMQSI